jgi:hypothetical protein
MNTEFTPITDAYVSNFAPHDEKEVVGQKQQTELQGLWFDQLAHKQEDFSNKYSEKHPLELAMHKKSTI